MFNHLALWTWPPSIMKVAPQRLVERVKAAHIDIIIPYISKRGSTEAENKVVDVHYEDKLHALVEEAHKQGIQVQGCFDDLNIYHTMPQAVLDLAQIRKDGSNAKVLCPANPATVDYQLTELRRVLTEFDYDGINLEDGYIYNQNTIYDPAHQVGQQFSAIPVCYCSYCRAHAPIEKPEWAQWKRDALTNLVKKMRQLINAVRPGIPFSVAARMPYCRSFYEPHAAEIPYLEGWNFCQSRDGMMADWVQWFATGSIDFVCPMSYFNDTRIVELETSECRQLIPKPNENVWIGLALGNCTAEYMFGATKKNPVYLNGADKIDQQMALLQRLGHQNGVFFSYGGLLDEHIPVIASYRKQ